MRRLWLTGYRSYELGVFNDEDPKLTIINYSLKKHLQAELDDGLEWLITGAQLGTEQWGVRVAHALKPDYPEFKTAVMLPFTDFGSQWKEKNQQQLQSILQLADFHSFVYQAPYQNPQQLRQYQQFMLSHTDGALLLYDPEQSGKADYDYHAIQQFQQQHDYPLTLIDLYELQDDAENYAEAHDPQ